MTPPPHRRCRHCLHSFLPDYRNAYHQRFCSTPACQHASKQASQRRWLRKPENRAYFCDPNHVLRVQTWRGAHPDYWRLATHRCHQVPENAPAPTPRSASTALPQPPTGTLQEFCRSKIPVLTELISRLGRCALQDDSASCVLEVIFEAQCILQRYNLHVLPPGQLELPINFHETG